MVKTGQDQRSEATAVTPGSAGDGAPPLPAWFDPSDELVRSMLPDLRLLCCVQREPHRGEHCPGIAAAWAQCRSREERPRSTWTNIDFMLDFLAVGGCLPDEFRYALGSIARAAMPGHADPENWYTSATKSYIAKLPMLYWSTTDARWEQYYAWMVPAQRCADRCGADLPLLREVLTVVCFAPQVADVPLDFPRLAMEVSSNHERHQREKRNTEHMPRC